MLPYARLTPGPGFEPLRAALYYLQRFVVQPHLRDAVARGIAAAIRLRNRADAACVAPDEQLRATLTKLRQDGYALLPTVARARVDRIRAYLRDEDVLDADGRRQRFERLPYGMATAAYSLGTVLGCPDVCELVNAVPVLDLAARYLGCKPTLSSLGIRWSLPGGRTPSDIQHFHRDVDDWRFIKVFVYLTDVAENGGPHTYVVGSHRTTGRMRVRAYDREDVSRRYGAQNVQAITGPAGTSFVADTYGIHMGSVPAEQPRLILQAQYSLLPIYAFRYDPVKASGAAVMDAYVNRLLVASAAPRRDLTVQPIS
jgi:hypothetical protein